MQAASRGVSALRAVPRMMATGQTAWSRAATSTTTASQPAPAPNHFNSSVTVQEVLSGRGEKVFTIKKDELVFDAVKTMVDRNIGSLIVVSDGQVAEGIMTERDYLEKVIVLGRSSKTTYVSEIMSEKDLVSVTRDSSLTDCMELMTEKRVRHIPVLDGKVCVGMISIGDVVHALLESYRQHAAHMESFIAGSY